MQLVSYLKPFIKSFCSLYFGAVILLVKLKTNSIHFPNKTIVL